MDHAELIAELPLIEQLPVLKRLELARKRRTLQLVKWQERESRYQNGEVPEPSRSPKLHFAPTIALLDATFRGDVDEIRDLLNAGVDPNSRNEDGLTSLHQCCIDENEEVLLLLLRAGADVNARDTELWTPLHAAACCGHLKIAKLLVENGADLLAVNADGNMPYDICDDDLTLDYLESEMARRGVTQEQIDNLRMQTERHMLGDMQRLHMEGANLEFITEDGATPLHIASANGYTSVVQFLLDCGVHFDSKDADSWQPIHAATCWAQPHIMELLVSYGADIHAMTDAGETPFDLCEEQDIRELILELSRQQAERFKRNANFVRDSRRLSKRKKPSSKFESPQYASSTSIEGTNPTSRVMRRVSLRDKSGATIARLEARQEALLRSRSLEDATADALENGVSAQSSMSSTDSPLPQKSNKQPDVTSVPATVASRPREDSPVIRSIQQNGDSTQNSMEVLGDQGAFVRPVVRSARTRPPEQSQVSVTQQPTKDVLPSDSTSPVNDAKMQPRPKKNKPPPTPPKPRGLSDSMAGNGVGSRADGSPAINNSGGGKLYMVSKNEKQQSIEMDGLDANGKRAGKHAPPPLNRRDMPVDVGDLDLVDARHTNSSPVQKFRAPSGVVVGEEPLPDQQQMKRMGCCSIS